MLLKPIYQTATLPNSFSQTVSQKMLAKGNWSPGPSYKDYIHSSEIHGPIIKDTNKDLNMTQGQRFTDLFNHKSNISSLSSNNLKFHKKNLSGSCVDISKNNGGGNSKTVKQLKKSIPI